MQMAAFPHQNYVPYAPDFPYIPSVSPFGQSPPSAVLQQAGGLASTSYCFPCYDHHYDAANIGVFQEEISTVNAGTSSIGATTTTTPTPESSSSLESGTTASPGEKKITSPSSSSVQGSEAASRAQYPSQKRKDAQRCASGSSANPNDAKDAKGKKPKKHSGATKEAEEQKASRQAPTGYIHVRARRGEATDSHSLAERVRRGKIREKMKTLQDLVPGCDKVVGKALLLEEIINYVHSLQNQVQFLSMKLASMDPMSHDFGLGFADYLIPPEELENISAGLPNVQGTSVHIQPAASADTVKGHPVHGAPVPFLLRGEGPPAAPFPGSTSIDSTVCELLPNYA